MPAAVFVRLSLGSGWERKRVEKHLLVFGFLILSCDVPVWLFCGERRLPGTRLATRRSETLRYKVVCAVSGTMRGSTNTSIEKVYVKSLLFKRGTRHHHRRRCALESGRWRKSGSLSESR